MADLEHLVRALGVPRIALVGWSMGGLLVLELAQRLGERVSALGLVCTTAGGLADAKNPLAEAERAAEMKKAIAADFRAFVRDFAPQLFKDPHSPLLSWATGQMQKTPPHVAEACFDALLAADLRAGAKKLKVPTAVLHGKHDALLPLAHGEDLAKRIPGAKLTVFAESGHAPFLEEPEAFNAALGKLLDLIADDTISGRIAKQVFETMVETGDDPAAIVEAKGLRQVIDTAAIDAAVAAVLAANAILNRQ